MANDQKIHKKNCPGAEMKEEIRPFSSTKDMKVEVCLGCKASVLKEWIQKA